MHICLKYDIITCIRHFTGREADKLETLEKELRFAAVGTLVLDVLVWLISLLFTGLNAAVPLGLLIGSAGMLCNLLLLRHSVLNAVYHGKTRDFGGYILRCVVASAAIAAGMVFPLVNGLCVILPFLYPKLLFGVKTLQKSKK